MRLVVKDRGLAPRALLVTPVGELRRYNRIDIGPDLRIAQIRDDVLVLLHHIFELFPSHRVSFLSSETIPVVTGLLYTRRFGHASSAAIPDRDQARRGTAGRLP